MCMYAYMRVCACMLTCINVGRADLIAIYMIYSTVLGICHAYHGFTMGMANVAIELTMQHLMVLQKEP